MSSTKFLRRSLKFLHLGVAQSLIVSCANFSQSPHGIAADNACPQGSEMRIDHPAKIGIGAWEHAQPGWAANRLRALGVAWYYVWGPEPISSGGLESGAEFVPMIRDAAQLRDAEWALSSQAETQAAVLLGFNEPDRPDQANMTVEEAIAHWPRLAAAAKRLGSPAPSKGGALPPQGWLARFLDAARASNLRVDFIAVHYYAAKHDIAAFRSYLERVYRAYDRPIWVTEWGLVDPNTWKDGRARYDPDGAACFFRSGAAMLDDLDFVERHAWFAAFDGGDGWHLNTHAIAEDGSLTPVGRAFVDATATRLPSHQSAWEPALGNPVKAASWQRLPDRVQ